MCYKLLSLVMRKSVSCVIIYTKEDQPVHFPCLISTFTFTAHCISPLHVYIKS